MNRIALSVGLCALVALTSACGGGGGSSGSSATGTLFFSQDSNANGLFRLSTTTGAGTLVGAGTTTVTGSTVGLTEGPNASVLLGSKFAGVLQIQADGSGAVVLGAVIIEALGYMPNDGLLYGGDNGNFYTLSQVTGAKIATLPAPGFTVHGLAADAAANVIYGIGASTNLAKYTISTGVWSTVGNTGINWSNGGLAHDSINGRLFAVGLNAGGNLHIINKTTGADTVVGPVGVAGSISGGLGFVVTP